MRRRLRTLTPPRRSPADERGSTLIFALVMIIVVAVAGAAVLSQESVAPNAQVVYSTDRDRSLTADGATDAVVQTIRLDKKAGVYDGDLAHACTTKNQFTRIGTPAAGQPSVYCQPFDKSGQKIGTAPDVPPFTVLALGGSPYVGGRMDVPGVVTGFTNNATYPFYYPFCDNFHDYQSGVQERCEASIFVGRNVSNDATGNGKLTIESNGTDSTAPLVRSNGAIILSDSGNGVSHTLDAWGTVQARRTCGWGNGKPDENYVHAGIDKNHQLGQASSRQCNSDYRDSAGNPLSPNVWTPAGAFYTAPTGSPQTPLTPAACTDSPLVTTNCLWPDPDWIHEPIDPLAVPRVDATAPSPYKLDASALCNNTGFVAMPAKAIPGATIPWTDADGNVQPPQQMYEAWYDSARDLNQFMQACTDTVFWFRPGVYYFDFLDVVTNKSQPAVRWVTAKGQIPTNGTGTSLIIAGTPKGWTKCNGDDQPSNADIMGCQQQYRIMKPQDITFEQGAGFALKDDGGELDTLDGVSNDGSPGRPLPVNLTNGFTNDGVKTNNFQTPIPLLPNVNIKSVNGLHLEVAYNLPATTPAACLNPAGTDCYKDTSVGNNMGAADPYTTPQGPGAELQIRLGGSGAGACFVHLPTGDHTGLIESSPNPGSHSFHAPSYPAQTGIETTPGRANTADYSAHPGEAIDIDLTNGCNNSIPGFEKVNTPCATVTSTSCFPVMAGGWDNKPEWINYLQAEFFAQTPNSTPGNAPVIFDGLQFDVKWKGRPAPTFPDGCDTVAPGVQWIFGASSRIDWSTTDDMYSEICANKQSSWPGVDSSASGANYGIGIYGLSEDSGGPWSPAGTTGPAPPVFHTRDIASGVTVVANPGGNIAMPSAAFSRFGKIDGTEPAGAADWGAGKSDAVAWNDGTKPARLIFQIPSNTWTNGVPSGSIECGLTAPFTASDAVDPPARPACAANSIPYGSKILNVKLKIHHREGEWSTNGWPFSGTFSNCAASSCVNSVQLKITPGPGFITGTGPGSGQTGSNGNQTGTFDTSNEPAAALNPTTIPLTRASDPNGWRTWVWGDNSPNTSASQTAGNPATADWSLQRDLTDALSSPEALAGATFDYTVTPKNNTNWHYAEVDGIELDVTYRPAGSLRPLDGCNTIRPALAPSTFEGVGSGGSGGWVGNVYNGGGHDWLDADWAVNPTTGGDGVKGDQPIGDLQGSNMGNGADNGDKQDCALVNVDDATSTTKIHVSGAMYAPSAALSLSGNDNDAPWASDGIVARQLSALRWKKGKNQASVGDNTGPGRYPRKVTLIVCDPSYTDATGTTPCTAPKINVRAVVQIDDQQGTQFGYSANILSWIRNPSS